MSYGENYHQVVEQLEAFGVLLVAAKDLPLRIDTPHLRQGRQVVVPAVHL